VIASAGWALSLIFQLLKNTYIKQRLIFHKIVEWRYNMTTLWISAAVDGPLLAAPCWSGFIRDGQMFHAFRG